MENLSTPSKELISRISHVVDFKDRLIGYSVNFRSGPTRISLYSLEEVFALLTATYPQIAFNQLAMWISDVIRDEELAGRIKTVIVQEASDRNTLLRIRDLVGLRLIQCRQAV